MTATGQLSKGGIFPRAAKASTLSGMQQAAVKDAADTGATSVPSAPPRQRPIRFHPEDQERLRIARLDLIARHRAEFDESAISHQFYLDEFDGWLARQLNPDGKPNGKKRSGGA